MVSNASEDLPEPLTPVTTVMRLIGIENEMFLRLLTRAPRTSIASWVMIGACETIQKGIRRLSQTPHLNSKDRAKRKRGDNTSSTRASYEISHEVSGWFKAATPAGVECNRREQRLRKT